MPGVVTSLSLTESPRVEASRASSFETWSTGTMPLV